MPLILDAGCASHEGKRPANADACTVYLPELHSHSGQTALLAISDSLDGRDDGGEAARCAVETLRESFFAAPQEWEIRQALKESFSAANVAVAHEGGKNRAATLSALVLNGHNWVLGHVGDTRVWLYRDQSLKQLTHDHTQPSMEFGSLVTKACGLEEKVDVELAGGECHEGDVFLLTSDGVHDTLDGSMMMSCLMQDRAAEDLAKTLIERALAAGTRDNASACVLRIEKLPQETSTSVSDNISALPIRPLPEPGETVDGFNIEGYLHKGRTTVVYKAIDSATKNRVALRFPNPKFSDDPDFIDTFLREEWIGKRHDHPSLIKTLPAGSRRRTTLYSVLEYHRGESLAKRIRRKQGLSVRETQFLAKQLLDCLQYLHSKGITHRDIKPSNILIDKEKKQLLLVGFGLSSIERLQDAGADARAYEGTKSYRAPELLQGHKSDKRADLFSVGVTLYKMLTQRYPYGRINQLSADTYKTFRSPQKYKSDIPEWLVAVLKKTCAVDPKERYHSAEALAIALTGGPTVEKKRIKVKDVSEKKHRLPQIIRTQWWQWGLIAALLAGFAAFILWYLL